MVATSKRLGFPLMAGSSLPVAWRMPPVDVPLGEIARKCGLLRVASYLSYTYYRYVYRYRYVYDRYDATRNILFGKQCPFFSETPPFPVALGAEVEEVMGVG